MLRLLAPCAFALLAACGGPTLRYAVPPVPTGDRIAASARGVEVRDVTLPAYAEIEEIFFEGPDGALTSDPNLLWADLPSRAMTLQLSRTLAATTGARVAAEPWPFDAFPDARVEVRVSEMVAGRGNVFRLSGVYYVGRPDGTGAERSGDFAIAIPYDPEGGVPAIAAARAAAVRDLGRLIARDGL